jgi:hypothetical protein
LERQRGRQEIVVYERKDRLMAIKMERTNEVYRGATGTSQMRVSVVGGSWDELFEELKRHPKVFYEMPVTAFRAEREVGGKVKTSTPSIGTIQRELDRQAWFHGLVLGYQDVLDENGKVRKDRFRVCMRTTELQDIQIPKRIEDLDLTPEQFGVKAAS